MLASFLLSFSFTHRTEWIPNGRTMGFVFLRSLPFWSRFSSPFSRSSWLVAVPTTHDTHSLVFLLLFRASFLLLRSLSPCLFLALLSFIPMHTRVAGLREPRTRPLLRRRAGRSRKPGPPHLVSPPVNRVPNLIEATTEERATTHARTHLDLSHTREMGQIRFDL